MTVNRAARLLEALERALAGHPEAIELSACESRQGTTRFANSRVTQTGDVEDRIIQARVAAFGHVGAASTGALDPESIGRAIAQALAMCAAQKNAPASEPPPAFADQADGIALSPAWDEATALAGAAERARLLEPAFRLAGAARLEAAGLALITDGAVAVATSAGARRAHRYTTARLEVIAQAGEASGRVSRYASQLAPIETSAAPLAEDAIGRAERSRNPIELEPGAYDVILEPAALGELVEWLSLTSLGARSVEDGSSFLAGAGGQRITGPVTLYDDALAGEDGCPLLPFDSEGTSKRRLVLLDGGIAGTPVHDRASAARAGQAATGHAPPVAEEVFDSGPLPQHLHFAAGVENVAELLARVERGVWVSRFHYVNGLLDTRRALMTGMTRDGLFLIENGRLGRGVRNLRFTESVLEALERLEGVTRARQVIPSSLNEAVTVCPTVLVRGWRFTGKTR